MQKSKKFELFNRYGSDYWVQTFHLFSCVRCVNEFNQIFKYLLLAFYVWMIQGMSSLLVTFQFLLVEYFHGYSNISNEQKQIIIYKYILN